MTQSPTEQISALVADLRRIVNRRWWRWYTIWFGRGPWVVVSYRLDRALFLLCGRAWVLLRPLFFPLFFLLDLLGGRAEIHYRAQIGPGLLILHSSLGVVVNGSAVVGRDLVLAGGNCIGLRGNESDTTLIIGDDVQLGVNAVVLGPVRVGDGARIGAGAVVVSDVDPGAFMIGVPAVRRPTGVAPNAEMGSVSR
ncbi:MAG TPA: DapH/DapD/GlmU-related protein [Gemmatimonadaceae bacterium]|nr:DapH/DapD/GlmU-related protein [Gemmatimonadaceae bacterium]